MKKIVLGVALAVSVIGAASFAGGPAMQSGSAASANGAANGGQAANGLYLTTSLGAAIPMGDHFTSENHLGAGAGLDFGVGMGYKMGQIRLQGNLSYIANYINNSSAHYGSLLVMANGLYDFNMAGSITPYVGAGLGINHFTVSDSIVTGTYGTYFAYQVIAGASYNLGSNFSIGGEYHFVGTRKDGNNLFNNLINAVVRFNFGS